MIFLIFHTFVPQPVSNRCRLPRPQVRQRRRLGHLPALSAVPAAPYRLGVGRLVAHAWPPAHQYVSNCVCALHAPLTHSGP